MDPVSATPSILGSEVMRAPTTEPLPGTNCRAARGMPARCKVSTASAATAGVWSAGLASTQLPAASAALMARRVPLIMLTAVALGAVSAVVGLLLSFHHDTAASATMALVSVVLFLLVVTTMALRRAVRGTSLDPVAA